MPESPDVARRQHAIMDVLVREDVDAFLTFDPTNRTYLTGFTGSAGHAILTALGDRIFISDPRYTERAAREAHGFRIVETHVDKGPDLWTALRTVGSQARVRTLAFEADLVSVAWLQQATSALPDITFHPTKGLVEALRRTKDPHELDALKRAQAITDDVFAHILGHMRPGVSERDLATEIRHQVELRGAQNYANLPIVASGPRSAEGHAYATDRPVQDGDFVLLDFGARVEGYYSDMTRTVVCGKADDRQRQIHGLVQRSIADGIAAIRSGAGTFAVKAAGRRVLITEGYADFLRPGLGHGVGLQVHEAPFMREDVPLLEGDVVTFEPGVYIPGWGGVRIEDSVLVTAQGCEVLPRSPRGLIETG